MTEHLLSQLSLPSRYEPLVEKIGPEVLRLLVPPARRTLEVLEEAAASVHSLAEGLFLPIFAVSGTGKTTLAQNLVTFLPANFTETLTFGGDVSADALSAALQNFMGTLPANESRVVPINIDHREGRPATPQEVTEIKRFLRQGPGRRCLVIWPETQEVNARAMSDAYRTVAGVVPLDIPVEVAGPNLELWQNLAAQTMLLANHVDSLDSLVDLAAYDPSAFRSIGDYLRQIALDFNKQRLELIRATVKPVRLAICFVSETSGHGILSGLASSSRFGMLDPSALIQACPDSVIGRWWNGHRGLLVQTIVSLDAHMFSVSPPLSLAIIRRYGPEDSQNHLADLGFAPRSPAEVDNYLKRSDLGRHLAGEQRSVSETRGNPADEARTVFNAYADYVGFGGAKDKKLNAAVAAALMASQMYKGRDDVEVTCETGLSFLPQLIPDVAVLSPEGAQCLEFTYRKGDFLESKNRATVATYCLEKLKNYARQLRWVAADA